MGEKCPKCGKEQSHNQRVNWTCEDKDCGATVHGFSGESERRAPKDLDGLKKALISLL